MKKFNWILAILLVVGVAFSVSGKHREPKHGCKCESTEKPHHRAPQVREHEEYPRNDGHHRPPQRKGVVKGTTSDGKTAYVYVGKLLMGA